MSRNQFRDTRSLQWTQVLKYVVIAAVLLLVGLSFLVAKNQQMRLAEEAAQGRKDLAKIVRSNDQLKSNIDWLNAPRHLQSRISTSGLIPISEMPVIRRDIDQVASR
ncbi:MAG: hypothetical protein B9S32_02690 [Verrucomicrobia bacterium Tous-C9LFEB]|nr:MAG: hypothetical protein B9S32_02690 [Verrucomicrobia bacterium Tous-C9LFEB]